MVEGARQEDQKVEVGVPLLALEVDQEAADEDDRKSPDGVLTGPVGGGETCWTLEEEILGK